jgi:hypothetical protein
MNPTFETVATTESLLSDAFSSTVQLGEGKDLGGSRRTEVYRFPIRNGGGDLPASVIVKQAHSAPNAVYNPELALEPAWTFFNDWASLQFLSQFVGEALPAPRLYAGDRAAGLIVMEDLGEGQRLDHFLLGNDPFVAEESLVEFAALHGRLHALTRDKRDEFTRIRESLGPVKEATNYYSYEWLAPTLHQTANIAGINAGPGVDAELAALRGTMLHPGPFLTFTQGDSCPDNCLRTGTHMRLIDFEGGMLSHALKEGVYGRMHFPTCWCVYRLPAHVPLRMEEVYRAELVKGCPEAADDTLFYRAVVESCALWMLDWYHEFPLAQLLEKDRMIVTSTVRQRLLLRSEIFSRTTEEFGHLEAFGETVKAIATKLSEVWPPDEYALPYYPAFR